MLVLAPQCCENRGDGVLDTILRGTAPVCDDTSSRESLLATLAGSIVFHGHRDFCRAGRLARASGWGC